MPPDVLLVGHITNDSDGDGWRTGGSVLYAAAQCRELGLDTAVVTACATDVDPLALVPGVEWRVRRDETTLTFENRYEAGVRRQRLLARGRELSIDDIPEAWQGAPVVMLAPLFHDVDPGLIASFSCSATALGILLQGWLRRLDITNETNTVTAAEDLSSLPPLQGADAVFASEEDITSEAFNAGVAALAGAVPAVVFTRGRRGCTVWHDGRRDEISAFAVEEVDPTGAGDVFAAAFLTELHRTGDAVASARFASAAAALSVRAVGVSSIGNRLEIESLLAQEKARSR